MDQPKLSASGMNELAGYQALLPVMYGSLPTFEGDLLNPLAHLTSRTHMYPFLQPTCPPSWYPIIFWNAPHTNQLPIANQVMNARYDDTILQEDDRGLHHEQLFDQLYQTSSPASTQQPLQIAYPEEGQQGLVHFFAPPLPEEHFPVQFNQCTTQEQQITSQACFPYANHTVAAQLLYNENIGPQHPTDGHFQGSSHANVPDSLPRIGNAQQSFSGYPIPSGTATQVLATQVLATRNPLRTVQTNELNAGQFCKPRNKQKTNDQSVQFNENTAQRNSRKRRESVRQQSDIENVPIHQPDVPIILPDWSPFFAESMTSSVTAYASRCLKKWGINHPMGNVASDGDVIDCCFFLKSGVTCYAKLEPSGIKFSSNQRGTSFIVDEAGVRTCWAHFKSAKAILKSRCIVKYKETQSFKTLVYDFDHGANYPVSIHRDGIAFSTTAADFGVVTFNVSGSHVSARHNHNRSKKSIERFFLKTYLGRLRQILACDGRTLRVTFHTQMASLDSEGSLSLEKWTV